jgi:hypothetical protein
MLFTAAAATAFLAGSAAAAPRNRLADMARRQAAPETDPNSVVANNTGSLGGAIPAVVPVNTRAADPALISQLMLAPTQAERFALLDQPGDSVFDFTNEGIEGSEALGLGGFSINANARTFPALIGNGISMTVGFIEPCGMNTAHVHPRGTELNIVVQGRLVTNFVQENTVAPRGNTMDTFQMTVFPQGAIHQEYNPDCTPTTFVAAFPDADAGVGQVAQNFFDLEANVLTATLGGVTMISGEDLESFRDLIPNNFAQGIQECLDRCGITRGQKRSIEELREKYMSRK